MSAPFCEPFAPCENLDGRLLISAVIEGPPPAWDLGEVSFGSFTANSVAARPYVDIKLNQTWTPKQICYGPIRSIFSLAPGETVQIVVQVRRQFSVAQLVSSASVDSHSTQGPDSVGGVSDIQKQKQAGATMKQQEQNQMEIQQKNRVASSYGSILEGVANFFLPGIGGAIVDAAEGVAKHVNETSTGTADGIKDAMNSAGRAVDTIARSETQHNHSESTTTTDTTETMQSLTRTFSNPYRDRSLQLRFIPVFRHFGVQARPASVTHGVSLHLGATRIAGQAGVRVSDVLADATTRVDASALQQPLASMVAGSREASLATRGAQGPSAVGALRWSQSTVREDSVLVPLAAPETAASAFGLKGESRASFLETLGRITPDAVAKLVPVTTQEVHLFIGTHIEPVAGECILKDVPPPPAVTD